MKTANPGVPFSLDHFRTRRDAPDAMDHRYTPAVAAPPASVDLSAHCGPSYNQGNICSCSAHAVGAALTWIGNRDGAPIAPPSRLFMYYNARRFADEESKDCGATMRNAIKSIVKVGVCPETAWPYDPTQVLAQPPATCYATAALHALAYQRIDADIAQLKACLAEGFPFVFAIEAYAQAFTAANGNGGKLPLPAPGDTLCGGHAVMAVGYGEDGFKAQNSLGPTFGADGFFTIPYGYFAPGTTYAYDFWTIRKIS